MGPFGQRTPHVIETKTRSAALLYWRGQSSPTVNLPAVTSSPDVLLDLAHTMLYLVGLLVGAINGGGGHGGAEVRVDGVTPMEATATRPRARMSITELRWTYLALYCGLQWSGWV